MKKTLLLGAAITASAFASPVSAKFEHSAGGVGVVGGVPSMPPMTSMPGMGAGHNGSPYRFMNGSVGSVIIDESRVRKGERCRYVQRNGGKIPEC